jgi:L-alanine-DL-glutamate epimerase-like enolase superfamily enzyme
VSGLFKPEGRDHVDALAEEARHYRDMGFQLVKMKMGFEPEVGEHIVSKVRSAIGNRCGVRD